METKEIKTVVEKITKQSEIDQYKFDNKELLISKVTKGANILLAVLPLTSYPGITLESNEKLVYLGLRSKETNKFLTEAPSSVNTTEAVFKAEGTNRVITLRSTAMSGAQLIENTDLTRLSEVYTVTYTDLPATKRVLGLYRKKMDFANTVITDFEVDLFEVYTLSNAESYIMSTQLPGLVSKHNEEGKVKFCVQDLDFKCLINKKGYNLPKDRTVKIGSNIRFMHKGSRVEGVIEDIMQSKMQYTDKDGKKLKQRLYVVIINGVPTRLRKKDFKVI